MFIVSLNYTKFNSRHLLLQQIFTLSSIVITIDDKNYLNETMVTGSCLDHSDVKGLVALRVLQVLSCISSCWELAGRAVVSNCSLCGSFAGFAIFPAWELPGWTFASLAWCILVAENIFHTKSPFALQFCSRKGLATLWWCVSVYFHLADNPSEASFKPLQYVTMCAMGLSWH